MGACGMSTPDRGHRLRGQDALVDQPAASYVAQRSGKLSSKELRLRLQPTFLSSFFPHGSLKYNGYWNLLLSFDLYIYSSSGAEKFHLVKANSFD